MYSVLESMLNQHHPLHPTIKQNNMKKIYFNILFALFAGVLMVSCNKSISDRTANINPLSPANLDLTAGNWRPVLLSRPDTFAVAAPLATNSPAYIADLNE